MTNSYRNAFGRMVSEAELDAIAAAAFGREPMPPRQPVNAFGRVVDQPGQRVNAFGRVLDESGPAGNDRVDESGRESTRVAQAREECVQAAIERDRHVIHGADEAMRRRIAEAAARGVVEPLTAWAMREAWTEDELVAKIAERAAAIRAATPRSGPPKRTLPTPQRTQQHESGRPAVLAVPVRRTLVTEADLDALDEAAFGPVGATTTDAEAARAEADAAAAAAFGRQVKRA